MTGTEPGPETGPETYTLLRHAEPLAVVRLSPGADVPDWAGSSSLLSVTATATETSLVCGAAGVPRKLPQEGPFTAFVVDGTLDFSLTGVLSTLLDPLARAGIPVFVLSTFDTDWVLVAETRSDAAEDAWRRSGHTVRLAQAVAPSKEPS